MEIWPLAHKPRQESLIATMKKVRANDVYQKNQLIKQQAKSRNKGRTGSQPLTGPQQHLQTLQPAVQTTTKMICPQPQRHHHHTMRNGQDGAAAIEKQPTEENDFAVEDPPQPREMEGVQLIERSRTQSPSQAAIVEPPQANSFQEMLDWSKAQQIKVIDDDDDSPKGHGHAP